MEAGELTEFSNMPPHGRLWWREWWEADFTWDGLASKTAPADHVVFADQSQPISLQSYWRWNDQHPLGRTDHQMGDELVADPVGRLWHLVHVPDYWSDGTPAKVAWDESQHEKVRRILYERLASSSNMEGGSFNKFSVALLSGVIAQAPELGDNLNAELTLSHLSGSLSFKRISKHTTFRRCLLVDQLVLYDCVVEGNLDLDWSVLLGGMYFHSCTVAGSVFLNRSDILNISLVSASQFSGGFQCSHAIFHKPVYFSSCLFLKETDFSYTEFRSSTRFSEITFQAKSDFSSAKFLNFFEFPHVVFAGSAFFTSNSWAEYLGSDADRPAYERAFYNARFQSTAAFQGTGFGQFAAFEGAVFEGEVHLDEVPEREAKSNFKSHLRRALSLPDPQRRIASLRSGCQTIRRAMEKASDKKRSVLLSQMELRARRYQRGTPASERCISCLYGWLSDYGSSVLRPLVSLVVILVVFGAIYGFVGGYYSGDLRLTEAGRIDGSLTKSLMQGLTFSAERAFPFGPWTVEPKPFEDFLLGNGTTLRSVLIRLMGTLQSIASAVLIFLAALAVKQRFQIG